MAHPRLLRSATAWRVAIPPSVLPRLRDLQASQRQDWWSPCVVAEDAVLLDPGMGPAMYLTFDGRILEDRSGWDGGACHEVDDPKVAWSSLIVGADKQRAPELLRLLPARSDRAAACARCGGSGRFVSTLRMLCPDCGGLGWQP